MNEFYFKWDYANFFYFISIEMFIDRRMSHSAVFYRI